MTRAHYQLGNLGLHKNDTAMNLATDGFRLVAFEHQWNMAQATQLFEQLGAIEENLTEADCQEFISGLENTIHDSELLYCHVTNFIRKMLHKWQVIDLTHVANEDF